MISVKLKLKLIKHTDLSYTYMRKDQKHLRKWPTATVAMARLVKFFLKQGLAVLIDWTVKSERFIPE